MTYEEIVKINGMEKFAKPVYPCCIARVTQLLGGAGWTIDHWLSNQTFLFHQLFLRPLFRKIYWVFEEYDWHGGEGGLSNLKTHFDLCVEGDGLDMYQQLKGGFESMRAILAMWGLGAKNGS